MKYLTTIASLLFLSNCLSAQEPISQTESSGLAVFSANQETLVFGDKINVRSGPKKDASVLTQLLVGEAVKILAQDTATLTLNGWTANWAKIEFNKNGKQQGYVWGGVLSPTALRLGDVSFVYGVVRSEIENKKEEYAPRKHDIEIRAVKANRIISTVKTELVMESGYSTQAFLYEDLGLPNFNKALNFNFFYEACGYPSYDVWCLWDGSSLTALPTLTSVADGGVFYDSEEYIFPENKEGVAETLLYKHEHYEVTDEENELDYDKTERVRKMKWNGKTYEKPTFGEKK